MLVVSAETEKAINRTGAMRIAIIAKNRSGIKIFCFNFMSKISIYSIPNTILKTIKNDLHIHRKFLAYKPKTMGIIDKSDPEEML
jgi:hypothetical protein